MHEKFIRNCFYHSSLFSSRFGNFKKTGKKIPKKIWDTEGTFSGRSVMLLGEGGGNCNLKKKTHICMSSLAFTLSDAVVKEITGGVKERSSLYIS